MLSLLILHKQPQQAISWSNWGVQWKLDFIWQLDMTSSMVGLRTSSKALPKVKLPPKIGHGHWWSAAHLIHYSVLMPSKVITCEKYILSLSMRCTKNYNTCCWHWLTARAQFFSMTTDASEVEWSICHIHLTSRQLTTIPSSILTTFCRENTSATSRVQKMLSKSLSNPEAQIFMLQE